jgi:sec-independent protein translocase protein TatB
MDSIFGIGFPELVLILILASIVMGPRRIGQAARWLGRTTAQLQAISREFTRQLNAELEAVDQEGDIKGAMQDVQELRRQVAELRRELVSTTIGTVQESKAAVQESRQMLEEAVKPPALKPQPDKTAQATNGELPPAAALPKPLEVSDDPGE